MIRVHLLISGIVQGVYYRQSTKRQAQKLDLKGWVRNLEDGRVEALVEGEKDKIEELIKWCHQGPSNAKVDNVEIDYQEYKNEFQDFFVTE